MASQPPPESVVFGQFTGMKNTVSQERLGQSDLERAINVDIDDSGQLRRRRGYTKKSALKHHSLCTIGGKTFVVRNGMLGVLGDDYSFLALTFVGDARVAYTDVAGAIYFSAADASGVIAADNTLQPWGKTNGQGVWSSPVIAPTGTLGAVGGRLLGDPMRATCLAAYSGRIYMAVGKVLWATELYQYHYVDRTKSFMQFEDEITLVMAVQDGLFVGTRGGLQFLDGVMHKFKLKQIGDDATLFGSGQYVPAEMCHPNARNSPMPTALAAMFMTTGGVMAGFDGGSCYNLTQGTMIFPDGGSAASLFRQDQGANTFIAAVDSAGGPSSVARIGDYCDAEIVRRL